MADWNNETRVAEYAFFKVNQESTEYALQISAYENQQSNATDAMWWDKTIYGLCDKIGLLLNSTIIDVM